jgi:hypothetical protein
MGWLNMAEDNRRKRTRVHTEALVDVHATGARLLGLSSRDLSHKGVFILGSHPLKKDQNCMITVHLVTGGSEGPDLHMEGKVVRSTKDGTAIDFVSMDPDTYMHLRNLILLNAEDPEKAEHEFNLPAFDPNSELD